MNATIAETHTDALAAAEQLLTRRTGATVTLAEAVDLGGSGQAVVLRVRVTENPFQLPRTLVIKQLPRNGDGIDEGFLREAVSYQFATALPKEHRPGPDLLAYDLGERLLILSDLGDSRTMGRLLREEDDAGVTHLLMAYAQALGRMHAATWGRSEDFVALLRRAEVAHHTSQLELRATKAVEHAPAMLERFLGRQVPDAVLTRARRGLALFGNGGFRAFSPSDLCPENVIVNSEGIRFLDYEWGGFRDATVDLAYTLVSFPECLCDMQLSIERSQAMIDAWRAEIAPIWPQLLDDKALCGRLLDARLVWVLISTWLFLAGEEADVAAAAEHELSVPALTALAHRWEGLARSAHHRLSLGKGGPALEVAAIADFAETVAEGLRDR
jgi:hypothetical protein